MYKVWLLLLPAILFFYSCDKNNDTSAPQINIASPLENQLFQVGDTVQLIAGICDDSKLNHVSFRIVNSDFVSATPAITIYPDNNCTEINHGIAISDMMLESGTYYVMVTAFDGTNTTNGYRKIGINAVDKRLSYILVLTKNDDQVTVHKIDSLNAVSEVKTIFSDYCGSAVSNDARQFYIGGRFTSGVSVFSLDNWQPQWQVPVVVNPPFPYFEAIDVHNMQLFVSFREGRFAIYDHAGNIIASRLVENGEFPKAFLPFKDYLITFETSPDGMQKHLLAYFVPSMAVYKKIFVNYDILKIFPCNAEECLLFCNSGNLGVVKLFSLSTGAVTDKYVFPEGAFDGVACIDGSQYLLISGNEIWYFSYSQKGFTLWATAVNPRCLMYEQTEGCFYFAENQHQVRKNRLSPQENLGTYTFQDTIINILPVYNRD